MNKLLAGQPAHQRPYWHVDAKWICGLALIAALGVALLFSVLSKLTAPAQGVEITATVMASLFSRGEDGIDEVVDTTELRRQVNASPTGSIAPIPAFPSVVITKADLDLPPRELRLKIFRQVAQPIYDLGVEGAAKKFASNPADQEKFAKDATYLKLITKESHEMFTNYSRVALGVAVLLLGGVVYFSYRWGRLANPGFLLIVATLPVALLSTMITATKSNDQHQLGALPSDMVPAIAAMFRDAYGPVTLLGVGLLVAAGIGKVVTGVVRKRK